MGTVSTISERTHAPSRTGARVVLEALLEHGVEFIFGLPGAAVLTLFDQLYDAPIRTILTRHEQGAGHMADGYARATGKVGVCLTTSGPGATNLVTAIATAYMDSVPVVAITGQVKTNLIGNDAFQEADMTGITRPITKHNYLVRDARELRRVFAEAFHIASTGRPGPVLIDLPADVTAQTVQGELDPAMRLPGYRPVKSPHPMQIRRAAKAINDSQRPVLYAGGGIISAGASEELRRLARRGNIPVTTPLMGLGCFPEDDPLSLKMLGMHGTAFANYAVTHCDLLIGVRARFDDRVTGKLDEFAPRAKVIHVDIDPASIGKSVRTQIPVVGDAKEALSALTPLVEHRERTEWHEQIAQWKRDFPLTYGGDGDALKPQAVIEEVSRVTNGRAITVTDVGQHQMWTAQFYGFREPRTFLGSGGLGTMGFGLPAAIGACLGRPGRTVFLITSDGSLQMNIQEMATAVAQKLPIKIVLLNNGYLGMVRQWQELFLRRRYSATYLADANPDFVALAEAYGARGILVERLDEVRPALEHAMAVADRPVLMDFRTAPEENVFPMVPAGKAIHQMLSGMA